jgi:hypothetical protein
MTVIGALSSFRELGEMSPHKRPCIESSSNFRVTPRGGYSDKTDNEERYRPMRCSPTEGRFSKPPQNDPYGLIEFLKNG